MTQVAAVLERGPVATDAASIARVATEALLAEVATWPKPGLVSDRDTGSHADMDAALLRASARTLTAWFAELADAGCLDCEMADLRVIGLRAEAAMLAVTGGVNTHRGAIFGLGLLCAAAGLRQPSSDLRSLGEVVRDRWGAQIAHDDEATAGSHGAQARRRFGAGGARIEAARGFPHVYRLALPALRAAAAAGAHATAARVQACFALIAELEDTNLLHRGGRAGLDFARLEARRFLAEGGIAAPDWQQRAARVHEAFVSRRLSPGGSADLLAMAIMLDRLEPASGPGGTPP